MHDRDAAVSPNTRRYGRNRKRSELLTQLATRNGADATEEQRRRDVLPRLARAIHELTGWHSELRVLRVADVIYHWRRGRDLLPGATTLREQRDLVHRAWKKVIAWKVRVHPERVTEEERALLEGQPPRPRSEPPLPETAE